MLLMTSNHPQRRRQSRPRVLQRAAPAVGAQRRALTDDAAQGTPPQMPSPFFSTRSRAVTAAFTHNSSRRLFFP